MANGQEVDVLEEGLRAEESSAELGEMRLMWRAEAEKAAQYFSAIPGFGHLPPEAPVGPARADRRVFSGGDGVLGGNDRQHDDSTGR
jgi:hypothetical protein